jgi:asparagine synthase (glutamine-hydrolysing)
MAKVLPHIIESLDEPISDAACVPTYFLSRLAREHVTVVLTGEGADELFAGYKHYRFEKLIRYYNSVPGFLRKNFLRKILTKAGSFRIKDLVRKSEIEEFERYLGWFTVFGENERKNLYADDFAKKMREEKKNDLRDMFYTDRDWLNGSLEFDAKTWLPEDLLMKVDKMSMAHSLEARVPYLDHDIVEEVFGFGSEFKLRGLREKHILKSALKGYLPDGIVNRKKHGFDVPIDFWLKNDLRNTVDERLSEDRIKKRGYFNHKYVKEIVDRHRAGDGSLCRRVWNLLCLEIWHEVFTKEG